MSEQPDNYEDDGENEAPRGALTTAQRGGAIARRDFGGQSLAITNPMTEAIAAQERAMVEARYIMAMRRPRDFDDVRAMILAECKRPGFAEVATYARPVGREKDEASGEWKEVFAEGLSIRFAEVALRRMGNMSCTARTIHDDAAVRMVQIVCLDYESGGSWETVITVPKTVERRKLKKGQRPLGERVNSYGDRVFIVEASDQDIATKVAAEISKASRTAILRLVPGEIQDEAFALCKQVAATRDAKDPAAAKKRVLDGFSDVGVRPSEVTQWLGHPVEHGTRDEFLELSRILSALRERELVWSDVLAERIAARAAKPKPAEASTTAPAATTAAPSLQQSAAGAAAVAQFVAAVTAIPATLPTKPAASAPAATNPAAPTPAMAARATGKGAEALKGALRKNGGAKPAEDPREAEPGWMAGSGDPERKIPPGELPPDTEPPAAGMEYRHCAGCECVIEVKIADPAGQRCYACTAADRDAE